MAQVTTGVEDQPKTKGKNSLGESRRQLEGGPRGGQHQSANRVGRLGHEDGQASPPKLKEANPDWDSIAAMIEKGEFGKLVQGEDEAVAQNCRGLGGMSPITTATTRSRVTSEQVWKELESASFAVVSYVTPTGESRSSGVAYATVGKRLFVAVAPDSWKARHIAAARRVAVTVPVRRGGLLTFVLPIPPATISFHAGAIVHPACSIKLGSLSSRLESLVPTERRENAAVVELIPEGRFLTYGIGVPLLAMRTPGLARAVVPVAG